MYKQNLLECKIMQEYTMCHLNPIYSKNQGGRRTLDIFMCTENELRNKQKWNEELTLNRKRILNAAS